MIRLRDFIKKLQEMEAAHPRAGGAVVCMGIPSFHYETKVLLDGASLPSVFSVEHYIDLQQSSNSIDIWPEHFKGTPKYLKQWKTEEDTSW
jgi:hypothetical protein